MKRLSKLFNIVVLISSILFAPSVFAAGPLDNVKGQQFFNGLLVQLEGGQEVFIAGDVINSHSSLLKAITQQKGKKAVKILWAGEIEVIDGLVTRINETAGIIKDKYYAELVSGLQVAGAGISAIKLFLRGQGKYIKEKLFGETTGVEYIKYDANNEHLDPRLKDVSKFRHDVSDKIEHISSVMAVIAEEDPAFSVELEKGIKDIKETAEFIFTMSKNAKEVSPLLKNSEYWNQVEKQLTTIIESVSKKETIDILKPLIKSLSDKHKDFKSDLSEKLGEADIQVEYVPEFKEGHKYMDGLLVELASGKKRLIVADVLVSHRSLELSLNYEKDGRLAKDLPVKILWAGEMEIDAEGNVIKVNSMAGLIKDSGLLDLFGIDGKGIDNLISFFKNEGKLIWEKFFSKMTDSDYMRYDGTHLHPSLEKMSKFRHNVLDGGFRSNVLNMMTHAFDKTGKIDRKTAGVEDLKKLEDALSSAKSNIRVILPLMEEGRKISTVLRDHPNWSKIQSILRAVLDLTETSSFGATVKELNTLYSEMIGELTFMDVEVEGMPTLYTVMRSDAKIVVKGIGDLTKNKGEMYTAIKSFAASNLLDSQEATNLNEADLLVIRLTAEACVTILGTGITAISASEFDSKNVNALQETKDKLDQIQKKVDSLFLERGIDIGKQDLVKYIEETFTLAATKTSTLFKAVFGESVYAEMLINDIYRINMISDATKIVAGIGDLTKNTGETYSAVKSFAASNLLNGRNLTYLNKAELFVASLTIDACVTILTYLSAFEFDSKNVNALQETKDKLDQIQKDVKSLFLEKGIDLGKQDRVEYSKETLVSAAEKKSTIFKAVFGDAVCFENFLKRLEEIERLKR